MTTKVDVLDKGLVQLVDHMGSDLSVVNAARVSFDKESEWDCGLTRELSKRDQKFIHYLAKHNHWTPFAHPQISLRVKAPIFVRTQLFKHKQGLVENEVSRRYVDDEPEFYEPDVWRGRPDGGMKQGSSGEVETYGISFQGSCWGVGSKASTQEQADRLNEECGVKEGEPFSASVCKMTLDWILGDDHPTDDQVLTKYKAMLEMGIAPEQARMVLPQSTYTTWIWTGSLAAFARVYKQRADSHSQWETQQYAHAISQLISPLFPVSWEALTGGKPEEEA